MKSSSRYSELNLCSILCAATRASRKSLRAQGYRSDGTVHLLQQKTESKYLVTFNVQFDSGLFINTQLQLGVGESLLGPHRFDGFAACGGRETVETVRRSALPKITPLKRGVNEGKTNQINLNETLACSRDAIDFNVTGH